jgi:uncharacterized protein
LASNLNYWDFDQESTTLATREDIMNKLIGAACAAMGLAAAIPAAAQNVGIATSNPGSLFHNIGTAVANAANAAGLNTTIQPATSPNQFIPFLDSGGIEFGVANLQEVDYAVTGDSWWNGQQYPNLRVVAHLQPLVEAIFVRADSDFMKVSDLRGQPMTTATRRRTRSCRNLPPSTQRRA